MSVLISTNIDKNMFSDFNKQKKYENLEMPEKHMNSLNEVPDLENNHVDESYDIEELSQPLSVKEKEKEKENNKKPLTQNKNSRSSKSDKK